MKVTIAFIFSILKLLFSSICHKICTSVSRTDRRANEGEMLQLTYVLSMEYQYPNRNCQLHIQYKLKIHTVGCLIRNFIWYLSHSIQIWCEQCKAQIASQIFNSFNHILPCVLNRILPREYSNIILTSQQISLINMKVASKNYVQDVQVSLGWIFNCFPPSLTNCAYYFVQKHFNILNKNVLQLF